MHRNLTLFIKASGISGFIAPFPHNGSFLDMVVTSWVKVKKDKQIH